MASPAVTLETGRTAQSILAHLPISTTHRYRKGDVLYRANDAPVDVVIVLKGVVAVSWAGERGDGEMLEVFGPSELLDERAFLNASCPGGRAVALGDVLVMTWAAPVMAEILRERPLAGIALLRALIQRNDAYAARIESFSRDPFEVRVARSLLRLAERLGEPDDAGWVRLMPFTHAFLGAYLGASRAAVTLYMSRFRRSGWITYSRQEIRIQPAGLRQAVRRTDALLAAELVVRKDDLQAGRAEQHARRHRPDVARQPEAADFDEVLDDPRRS
jgi:CRP/FNR family transcriptional regulator, nitrogen oxide reductase regulator